MGRSVLVWETVAIDRVAVSRRGVRAELFLEPEERFKDFVLVMEVIVHDVDEQGSVHYVRDKLA